MHNSSNGSSNSCHGKIKPLLIVSIDITSNSVISKYDISFVPEKKKKKISFYSFSFFFLTPLSFFLLIYTLSVCVRVNFACK